MATATTLSVLNYALVLCGATPISAITDDTPNARALNAVYEISRKSFLSECGWNFSATRSTLATAGSLTLMPWTFENEAYVYAMPSDVLSIVCVSDDKAVWRQEGIYIISDTNTLGLKYVYDNSEVGKWLLSALLAFIDKLCSDICFQVLNSSKKAEGFLEKYEKVSLPKAMAENAQTGTHQVPTDDEWTNSRFSNGGNPARSYG